MKGGHKKRVEKVREYVSRNKVFTAIAVSLIVFLIFNMVNRNADQPKSVQDESAVTAEAEDTSWRFYPIDLIVLGVGGGFCIIMIRRERSKTKEGLN